METFRSSVEVGETFVADDATDFPPFNGRPFMGGNARVVRGTLEGGDDVFIQTPAFTPRYVDGFGGDAGLTRSGMVIGGNDRIEYSNITSGQNNVAGDVRLVRGGTVEGGDDVIVFTSPFVRQAWLFGDVQIATGANSVVLGGRDQLTGGLGDDLLVGDVGVINSTDVTIAGDTLNGGDGNDTLYGDFQTFVNGTIAGTEGDALFGDAGNDTLFGQIGDDTLNGGTGDDFLDGGEGVDTVFGDEGDDTILSSGDGDLIDGGAGFDTVQLVSDTGGVNFNLRTGNGDAFVSIELIRGTDVADRIVGASSDDDLVGGEGDDTLAGLSGDDDLLGGDGDDRLVGNDGFDILVGGLGRDMMMGGADADIFQFDDIAESPSSGFRDRIMDFEQGVDVIDLRGIDAVERLDGDQAFRFIGDGDFSRLGGELQTMVVSSSKTIVFGDVDGDRVADFSFELRGVFALTESDFAL